MRFHAAQMPDHSVQYSGVSRHPLDVIGVVEHVLDCGPPLVHAHGVACVRCRKAKAHQPRTGCSWAQQQRGDTQGPEQTHRHAAPAAHTQCFSCISNGAVNKSRKMQHCYAELRLKYRSWILYLHIHVWCALRHSPVSTTFLSVMRSGLAARREPSAASWGGPPWGSSCRLACACDNDSDTL